jgi:hypothetical protein
MSAYAGIDALGDEKSKSGGNGIIVDQAERRYLSPLALSACSASGWRQDQDMIGGERRVNLGAEKMMGANECDGPQGSLRIM